MKNKVCILMGRLYKDVHKQLLEGIIAQLRTINSQPVIFTLNEDCGNDKIAHGDLNICNLLNFDLFDGVIFAPYTFSTQRYYEYIDKFLLENCPIPIVRIGIEKNLFIPAWYDDRAEMAELTIHLIHAHSCRDIICLTGPDHLEVSHSRLAGYRDAMNEAGIAIPPENEIFGDFWTSSPRKLAEEIASGRRQIPEAVICANDVMAITLCDSLTEFGIRVPEQVRITGYDGYRETMIHVPSITTYQTGHKKLGILAVCKLYNAVTAKDIEPCEIPDGKLLCRESCGCGHSDEAFQIREFNYTQFENDFLDNSLSVALHDVDNLMELKAHIYQSLYSFMEQSRWQDDSYYLCLCEDWNGSGIYDGLYHFRTNGYSEKMALLGENDRMEFDASRLLPDEIWEKYDGEILAISPANFMDRCFGYHCLAMKNNTDSYNMNYARFCRELNNGLEHLSVQDKVKSLAYLKYILDARDTLTGLYKLKESEAIIKKILNKAESMGYLAYIVGLKIEGMTAYREAYGSVAYDRFLTDFIQYAYRTSPPDTTIFIDGDDSLYLIGSESFENMKKYTENRYTFAKLDEFREANPQCPIISASRKFFVPQYDKFDAFLNRFTNYISVNNNQSHYEEITDVSNEIYIEPYNKWTLDKCSKTVNLSKQHFQTVYQRITGGSCKDDIHESRMYYAKNLILNTDYTLETIAEICGYDYAHFMRSFKKETGMTPKQFKQEMKSLHSN